MTMKDQTKKNNPGKPMVSIQQQKVNRIDQLFARHRQQGRTALMPFITAGYPDIETTFDLLPRLESAGATVCEIGIPYSDPIADGPVIAASMHEALENKHYSLDKLLNGIADKVRKHVTMGLVAMVSYSIVYRYGLENFVTNCIQAGFDGFIFPDLPVEEAVQALDQAANQNVTCSLLIAPTTSDSRAARIASVCTGFVYLLSRTGITGEREDVPDIAVQVQKIRQYTDLPIACGFGIASAKAVNAVTQHADAAIVGSAIVRRMQNLCKEPRQKMINEIENFVKTLAGGLASRKNVDIT